MNTGRAANRLSNSLVVAADVAIGAAERFLALRPLRMVCSSRRGRSPLLRLSDRLLPCCAGGEDIHTASLFPGDPALEAREVRVVLVQRVDYQRLTLTLPVLSAARVALFLVSGASKREALRRLLAHDDIPAARVKARKIVIIADEAATQ